MTRHFWLELRNSIVIAVVFWAIVGGLISLCAQ